MIEAKHIQQLDLNLLKIFECLYFEKNMSETAKVLYITPSAVSHAIKRLRSVLNDPLFERQGPLMLPTPACQRMAPALIDLLEKLRQVLQACGDFDLTTTAQTFKIALHDAIEPIVLPKLQLILAKHAPKANLASVKLNRDDMHKQLANHQIDMAIDVARPIKAPISHAVLSSDHFCVLMKKDHPLKNQLNIDNYLSAKHVAVSNRATGTVIEDIALLQLSLNREVAIRCQTYFAAKEVIKNSPFLLTLPSMIASQLLDETLIARSVPTTMPAIYQHLYWHQNTDKDDALIWLRSQVEGIFKR
ncbi:LysR family transcriptional regulator [Pseudoalteromonas sp. SWN29]|uniref:LysR family transcriptional regulator n=1 Tax=Pseudoalteromonas sp. SWN29 TaxID=2792064 RepID=UPI0018CD8585|nr:LysR family transcriptional regulator [Pseudoalteromonas sp. SWN29]MBH0029171.1 LysR family transcriptional regulator [Pseudoalteromonas sp. SWN29]